MFSLQNVDRKSFFKAFVHLNIFQRSEGMKMRISIKFFHSISIEDDKVKK